MDLTTRKVEITAHNHGFAVDAPLDEPTTTPYGVATVSHVCLNDSVVEGLELRDSDGELLSFSVQYHPEAAAGPHDASYLFDRFVDLMSTDHARQERLVGRDRPDATAEPSPRRSDGGAVTATEGSL
jgi:carbamoyl-phosphate synthase small subunit